MPVDAAFVEHPRVRPGIVERRGYQVSIAVECTKRNTLVVLPTGMGKTVVALLVMAHQVARHGGKVLFLAPTKPLVEQHAAFLRRAFVHEHLEVFTGEVPPAARQELWRECDVVCATPQVVRNDVIAGRIDLGDVSVMVFDEAHRAVGNYAYVFLADRYKRARLEGLVLGMTASPGANPAKIEEICRNLGIEGVEVRTEGDEDVAPYVQAVDVEWVRVTIPPNLRRVGDVLQTILDDRVRELRHLGLYRPRFVSKKELLSLQRQLQARLREVPRNEAGVLYQGLSLQAAALKVNHAKEMVETQGVGALLSYLDRLANDESKAAKNLLADPRLAEVRQLAERTNLEHPKLRRTYLILVDQLRQKPESRAIVFTHYRDMADLLTRELEKTEGPIHPVRFVGQASRGDGDPGLSQRQQVEILEAFKAGTYNTLVGTSVAEEGLDIPATDLVIFYEPVPSEIRAIQRRGRTGRRRSGRVVILMTEGTRDEAYHWASRGKEKKMRKQVDALRRSFEAVNASREDDAWQGWFTTADQSTLEAYGDDAPAPSKPSGNGAASPPADEASTDTAPTGNGKSAKAAEPVLVADHREFNSAVVRELARQGLVVRPEQLEVADFVLSDRLAVERKDVDDYAKSLLDGRLFQQVRALRSSYPAPLLVLEGADLLGSHRLEPRALYGSLASIVADFQVPVLHTRDAVETAELLAGLARREQIEEKRPVALRSEKGAMTEAERLRFVVEGLPGVSAVLAGRILKRFGTLRDLVNATPEELREVEGVGPKTAKALHATFTAAYEEDAP